MRYFFDSLLPNLYKSFTYLYFLPHLGAIVLTYIFVMSGFDWFYFTHMHSRVLLSIFMPAIPVGGILPIMLPVLLIAFGSIFSRHFVTICGYALGQATIIGSFISSLYKAFTGRIQPDLRDLSDNISNGFNFGFYEHGIFWGWPSSHTTIAFAMAVTVIFLFPTNKKIHVAVLVYAFYIGIGVSFSIHWFSDFIAGAIIGSLIGVIVGNSFRKVIDNSEKILN